MDSVLENVIKKITPTEKDRKELSGILKKLIDATDSIISPLGIGKTVAGSFIRDTWLSDKKELDIFILFPVSYSRKMLEEMGLKVGKDIMKKLKGKHTIAYAEHPYVKGRIGEFSIDIVPCYKVKSASNIKSAVDRTPFHNKYITGNLKPKMSGDVRLLKQFCKAADIYGSDVKTMGFSGYLCELLIIKYKSFKKLVNVAKDWKYGTFIDIEKIFELEDPEIFFKDQPLIVIDPTDPKRNVAAALSVENFNKFVLKCKKMSNSPSSKMFDIERNPMSKSGFKSIVKKLGVEIFAVKFKRPAVVDDILWSQMRRTARRFITLAHDYDFEVFSNSVWSDEKYSIIMLEMKTWELPEIQKMIGPPVKSENHSKEFIKKYGEENVHIEGDKLVVEIERKHRDFHNLISEFLKRSKKHLLDDGVRSHISKSINSGFVLMDTKKTADFLDKNKEFSIFIRKHFERVS